MSITDIVGIAKEVGSVVAQPALDASKEWINYVRNYDDNMKTVKDRHHELENRREEIEKKVDLGINNNEEVVTEVKEWIEEVDKFMVGSKEEWDELLDEKVRRETEKCCFQFCWSPRYRHNLSKKAMDKTTKIDDKLEKIRKWGQDSVCLPKRPMKLSTSTSPAFCRGLKSREDKLEDILKKLRDDNVNRIGIYGMGGAGKTTLVQELANKAENDKIFNAVIIAEISQIPDVRRIQDQIAERIGFTTLDRYHTIEERAFNLGTRLKGIKGGKRLYDDHEPHGLTKEGKLEDEENGTKRSIEKVPTKRNLEKASTMKYLSMHSSKKANMLRSPYQSSQNKEIRMERADEEGQIQGENHDGDDVKEGHVKGKNFGEDDKQGHEVEKGGKLLVILDNMWEKLDLHRVGIPYELQKDLGCKIIVTTRSEDVCKKMDAFGSCIFQVGDLSDEEAEHLFNERVGTIADNQEYKKISKELLEKTSRLPLSINVLADRLKNQTLPIWKRILKELEMPVHGETVGILGDTYSIIEMSYNYLGNNEKKMFFLLCCIFPPGSSVYLKDLLKYGIGMGLFQYVNSIVEAIDQTYKWAEDLMSLSLLTKVDVKKGIIQIHDDVREAGKYFVAKGETMFHVGAIPKWLKKESYEKYTVISLTSDNSYEYLVGQNLPKLKLLRSQGLNCAKLSRDYFVGMQSLKVLDMSNSDITSFPGSFENLGSLETLLLEHCSLKDISQVSKLVKLQVLSFRESDITRLPKGMEALVELKLLDMTNCDKLKEIPFGIFACLTQLEGLYMKHSFLNWTINGSLASLSELTSLPLQVLEITVQNISQLADGDFPTLGLSSYKIDLAVSTSPAQQDLLFCNILKPKALGSKLIQYRNYKTKQDMLFSRDLQLQGIHARDLVKEGWKPLMNRAESIYIEHIRGLKNITPQLGEYGWHELKRITVCKCQKMECFISRKAVHQFVNFPKLEMLKLENLPTLDAIYHGKLPTDLFVNLQELTLSFLNQLQPSAIAIQHAIRLKVLEVKSCKNLKSVFFAPTAMKFEGHEETKGSHEIRFPCLEKLILENLEAFEGLVGETYSDDKKKHVFHKQIIFPQLDKIKLTRLHKMELIWDDMATGKDFEASFPKLRSVCVKQMHVLKHVWSAEVSSINFENLRKLKIDHCDSLEYVCPLSVADGFQTLELLRIHFCPNLKQVIASEGEEGDLDGRTMRSKKGKMVMTMMSFPRLLTVDLKFLSSLTYFYQGKMNMKFTALKNLKLVILPRMKKLIKVEYNDQKTKTLTKVESRKITKSSKKKEYQQDDDGILFNNNDEVQFPCLEDLYLVSLDSIRGLWDVNIDQFSVMFPNIQRLCLRNMELLKHVWTKELNLDVARISIKLKEIEIDSCNSLESLFPPPSASNSNTITSAIVEFQDLRTIRLKSSEKFKYIMDGNGNVNLKFPYLKDLYLEDLEELVAVAKLEKTSTTAKREVDEDGTDDLPAVALALFHGKIDVPSLQTLTLIDLPHIEKVWDVASSDEFSQRYPSLQNLEIMFLPKLKYLWRYEADEVSYYLGSLETLILESCGEMESLFSYPTGTTQLLQPQKIISFPKLRYLKLSDLEKFSRLIQGYSTMEFQALTELTISSLPSVKTLVKVNENDDVVSDGDEGDDNDDDDVSDEDDTSIKEGESILEGEPKKIVEDGVCCMDQVLFKGNVKFSSLEELKLNHMTGLETIFETEGEGNAVPCSSIFPKLKTLHLIAKRLDGGVHLTGEPDEVKLRQLPEGMLHKLSTLAIEDFNQLKSLVSLSSSSSEGGQALVKSLSELVNLEELIIEDCKSLEDLFGVVDQGDHDVPVMLPSLKRLRISNLPKLKCVPWGMLPCLQSVDIARESLGGKEFLIAANEVADGSSLQSLESMAITGYVDIESIIGDDAEKDQEFKKDDVCREIVFPKLKEVKIETMISLSTFNSTKFTMRLPSLASIAFNRCNFVRSFSVGPTVISQQLSNIMVDNVETIVLDGDLNSNFQREFDSKNKFAKLWPPKVKSKLHEEHQLSLKRTLFRYPCDECQKREGYYSYTCRICDFHIDPICALNESRLIEEPDEMKVGKDLPRTMNHESHAKHELKLVAGRYYDCGVCHETGELFAYYCEECNFDLHPKCALK